MADYRHTRREVSETRLAPGLRTKLKRWRDRWRVSSSASSRTSYTSAPTTRPPTSTSSIGPSPTPLRLSPVPGSPYPFAASVFTPTTETFIHSPADPRNRAGSNTSSPSGTLKKLQPLSRRNTTSTDYLSNFSTPKPSPSPSDDGQLPMGMVTTIVAGNSSESLRKKRSSRFRLSISKRGPILPEAWNSPLTPGLYDRTSSRATQRFDPVEEQGERVVRKRADTKFSDADPLPEEADSTPKGGDGTATDDSQKGAVLPQEADSTTKGGDEKATDGNQKVAVEDEVEITPKGALREDAPSSIRVVEVDG